MRYLGDSFVIEKNGKAIAILRPAGAGTKRSLREVFDAWLRAAPPDPEWAEELERLGREDAVPENPWDSSSIRAR